MNSNLKTLYEFITQSLDPHSLSSRKLTIDDFSNWRTFMAREHVELRQKMVAQLLGTDSIEGKKNWMSSLHQQLLFASDLLNNFLFRKRQRWEFHPSAGEIRGHYLHSLALIEELLEFASHRFSDYYDYDLKLTDFQLRTVLPGLREILYRVRDNLAQHNISPKLSSIVNGGLQVLLEDHPSKNDARYIRHFYDFMQKHGDLDDHFLNNLLLKLDFNQPEFYLYLVAETDKRLFDVHGLHEQRELLSREKYSLLKIKKQVCYRLHPSQSPLLIDLEQYFEEREEAIEALLEIRRAAARDKVSPEQAFRILMDMTVPQIALFFRIQMEVGLMIKEQISEVYNFVAQHFYTEKAHFISSANMLKLSTTIEFQTVLKVHDMLTTMVKWLDEQFGVSNYSR